MVVASSATRRKGGDKYVLYLRTQGKKRKELYRSDRQSKKRLTEHNSGIGGKYTRANHPFTLIYYEAYREKKDAQESERFYKTGYGREILNGKLKHFLVN